METAAAAWLDGGAGILQIRHKGHWSRDTFDSARHVARLCSRGRRAADRERSRRFRDAPGGRPACRPGRSVPPRRPQAHGSRRPDRVLQPQPGATLRRRRRAGRLRRARPGLRDSLQAQPRPGRRRRTGIQLPRADRKTAGGNRRDHARERTWMYGRPAPIPWPSSPDFCRNPRRPNLCDNGWKNGNSSAKRSSQRPRPDGLHHPGDGVDDRLRRLHRRRRHLAPGPIARAHDHDVGRDRDSHPHRGPELWRTGSGHAAGRRPVRIPPGGLRADVRISLRLDAVHGDPDGHHRGGGGGLRQVYRRVLPVDLRPELPGRQRQGRGHHPADARHPDDRLPDLVEYEGHSHRRHRAERLHHRQSRGARWG